MVNVPAASSFASVYGPVPKAGCTQRDLSSGEMYRAKELYTTVGVTFVPSAQVTSSRSLKVTDVGVCVHEVATYGRTFPVATSSQTNVSYIDAASAIPLAVVTVCPP